MRPPRSSLLTVMLLACGTEKPAPSPGPATPKEVAPPKEAAPPKEVAPPKQVEPPAPGATRYEGSGTVLDKRGVGPQLCLGAVAQSLPPQCSGVPLVGWDWAKVEGEQTAGDTTWGEYRVVGTYDGERLTPTEPAGPPKYVQNDPDFTPPCAEPEGGWARPNPKKMSQGDLDRANLAAQRMPGYAGLWLYHLVPPKDERMDTNNIVLNVAFTKDLEKREAELRKLWGGALCVTAHERSEAEIAALRTEAEAMIREMGLAISGSDTDVVRGTIRVDVIAVTAEQLAKLAEKYGKTLVVTARLRPLP